MRESISRGYHEKLIGDRLEAKFANTPNLTPEERAKWLAEIQALHQTWQVHGRYNAPNPNDPQHYLLGLTDPEQVAINSINSRYVQEIQLKCEHLYGGMSRYSGTGHFDLQDQYENQLHSKMGTPLNLDAIPVEPLTNAIRKTSAEKVAERMADYRAKQQAGAQKVNQCVTANKGLRPKLVVQVLERKLANSPNLSGKERAEIQADIQAAYVSAGKGLDRIESSDPKNPNRAEAH